MQNKTYSIVHCTEKRIKAELGCAVLDWENIGIVWDGRQKMISSIPDYTEDEWVERFSLVDSKTFKLIGLGSCQTRQGVWEQIHIHFVDA